MAITFIYKIKSTGNLSLSYDTTDKKAAIMKSDEGEKSLNYILRDKRERDYILSKEYLDKMGKLVKINEDGSVEFSTISSFLRCPEEGTYDTWKKIRRQFGTDEKGILQYCIVQNFGGDVNPYDAHEIGVKFAEKYLPNYQVVVSTHINTGMIHNHIEFNATSLLGKKYNDCRKSIADIRKVSDALCDEYGLDVLEETRDYKIKHYRDENGVLKIFEPTERKNMHLFEEISDKNSYRNTEIYKNGIKKSGAHVEILKKDIDRFLPSADSYDDLLTMLEKVGYSISAKTKTGEWRKHITFKYTDWQKGVRDFSIGSDYEREAITERIRDNVKVRTVDPEQRHEQMPMIFIGEKNEEVVYEYGKMVIEEIDEDYYRKKKSENDKAFARRRYDIEKMIIRHTKDMNKELSIMLKKAMRPQRDERVIVSTNKRTQYFIDKINNGLKTLKFVEENNIKSIQQMNNVVRSMSEKQNEIYELAKQIKKYMQVANKELERIDMYNSLKASIEKKVRVSNPSSDYMLNEYQNEVAVLKTLERTLKEKKLFTAEQQAEFREKISEYSHRYEVMMQALEKVSRQISAYDDTIFYLATVDKEIDNRYAEQIKEYNEMKKEFKSKQSRQSSYGLEHD